MLELQARLLRRAIEIAGGRDALTLHLGVSPIRLEHWLQGAVRLPDPIFLTIVDLVLRDDIARASLDRRKQARTVSTTASTFAPVSASR